MNFKNKIFLFPLSLAVILFSSIIIIFSPLGQKNIINPPLPTPTLSPPQATISPLPTSRPDKELITEALAIKYNLAYAELHTIIPHLDATHAAGTVSFSGEGGWFLAYKEGNKWKIVADGNGTVSCEIVAPYKFPVSMLPECVDKNGQLIKL